jgi:hypothetical protein
VDDVITSDCICLGSPVGDFTCEDGIMNGDEQGIDCGGSCDPCPPPSAKCARVTVYIDSASPLYDGPGTNNIWWIPVADLDAGSSSSSESSVLDVKRFQSNIPFNWTTQGACVDVSPNGVYNNLDRGTVYRLCLPVTNYDFNIWKWYQLRISDPFGSDECYGRFRVVPQSSGLSAPSMHVVIPIMYSDTQQIGAESTEKDYVYDVKNGFVGQAHLRDLQLSPNPGDEFLRMSWVSDSPADVRVSIIDATGKRVMVQRYDAAPGLNELLVDMHILPSGVYIVHAQSDESNIVLKWVKQAP